MIEIIPLLKEHAIAVLEIYEQGLASGLATFNTEVPSWEDWDSSHHAHSRFVAVIKDLVVGWVAISPVSTRSCYQGVAEFSIYIRNGYKGIGLGSMLMQKLIRSSEAKGIWTLQSSTFLENKASIALQKKHGFREVGYRERIAKLNGLWKDTLLMERRTYH